MSLRKMIEDIVYYTTKVERGPGIMGFSQFFTGSAKSDFFFFVMF